MKKDYHSELLKLFESKTFPNDAFFIDKVLKDRRIIIYGAGESLHYYKEIVMKKYGYIPSVFLDRKFKQGEYYEGIPAYNPSEYSPSVEEKSNGIVIICLGRQNYFKEVKQTLKKMGYNNIISLLDIYEIHNPFSLPEALCRKGFDYYLTKKENILKAFDILTDDPSREIYYKCLKTFMERKPADLPMNAREEQYTPKDIVPSKGYSRVLYCGVSVEELKSVCSRVGKIEKLVCFEADPNQFRLTAEFFSENHESIAGSITALPCAVYDEEGIQSFTYSETSFGSRITPDGKYKVQSVSIDHILPGFKPTFIIMDIEGSELKALKGAEETLKNNTPDLAICVYHAPNHLWEIINYLNGLQLGYKFYLRNYTSFIEETVLYATAQNQ